MEKSKAYELFNHYFNEIRLEIEREYCKGNITNEEAKQFYKSLSANLEAMILEY